MQESQVQLSDRSTRREAAVKALRLQWATVIWNTIEGFVALLAGVPAGSVVLIGFGVDSLIENASSLIVAWRLMDEAKGTSQARIDDLEEKSRKIAGMLLILLAGYVAFNSARQLFGFTGKAHETLLGTTVTVAALIVMPLLAKAKLKAAAEIGSNALKADAMQSTCCAWLAFSTLLGVGANALFHYWWADSVAALAIVPLLLREGIEAIKGHDCRCHDSCGKESD